MKTILHSHKIIKFLSISFLPLLVANLLSILLIMKYGYTYEKSIIKFFNFDKEMNIPTVFSAFILGLNSLLFFFIAHNKEKGDKNRKYWFVLSFVFVFLMLDETISIHEKLIYLFRNLLNTKGVLYFAWVIPYAIASLVGVLFFSKFLLKLPKKTLNMFVLSGVIFIAGAIGMEMIGGNIAYTLGEGVSHEYNLVYMLCYTLEESLEMIGTILLIYSLLTYIKDQEMGLIKLELK